MTGSYHTLFSNASAPPHTEVEGACWVCLRYIYRTRKLGFVCRPNIIPVSIVGLIRYYGIQTGQHFPWGILQSLVETHITAFNVAQLRL